MKKVFLISYIIYCGVVNASSLYSPYPAVVRSNLEVNYLISLSNNESIDINHYLAASSDFSIYPLIAVPSLKFSSGILLSFSPKKNDLIFSFSSGIGLIINPFIYINEFYDMDFLILNSNRLSIGYGIKITEELILEPYVGGDFDLFLSTMNYYGVLPWFSLKIGLKIEYLKNNVGRNPK